MTRRILGGMGIVTASGYNVAKRAKGDMPPHDEIWLFDGDGADLGFMLGSAAASLARQQGKHLVRLDHASSPPRYAMRSEPEDETDRAREARIARGGEAKEIRLRVTAGTADIETRRRSAEGLLQGGYRVKLRVELATAPRKDPAAARALLDRLVRELAGVGQATAKPQSEKGAVSVMLAPR